MALALRAVLAASLAASIACSTDARELVGVGRDASAAVLEPAPPKSAVPSRFERLGVGPGRDGYHPLAYARERGDRLDNREAPIPIQCYTKTEGVANPCWTCHTTSRYPNLRDDVEFQVEYAFSEYGETNRWTNPFADRTAAIAAISDADVLAWIRQDNHTTTREILRGQTGQWGYGFDLDFAAGFGDDGFARDGSGWRAFRYKPFPGAFWPTNGSTDDVMVRLPLRFRTRGGVADREVAKANLTLLEASIASDPTLADGDVVWPSEPLDERLLGRDLDGDGALAPAITVIRGLPKTWLGDADALPLARGVYPAGVEFLHSVRYVDPDAPSLVATRMKELRWLRKEREVSRERVFAAYDVEAQEKYEGELPRYGGNAETGLLNAFGWRVQGYIEDGEGRLRLQSLEEHYACMGCHSGIGVTVDSTFAMPRKVPGAAGWGWQDIREIPDVPQLGHAEPEVLTYLRRTRGGDELRANDEMLARFFPDGVLDEASVRRAAVGGDQRLPYLVAPSRERALLLDKAYMVLVREQKLELGRDVVLAPPVNVHAKVEAGPTGLAEAGKVYRDGVLRLDWTKSELWPR